MDSPSSALIGVVGVALGSLIVYGAYKNVSIFGANGLLGETIASGSIPDVNSLPPLFGPHGIGKFGQTTLGAAMDAISSIGKTDPALASSLTSALTTWSATGNPPDGSPRVKALIQQARSKGFNAQADAIQSYVMDVARNPFADNVPGTTPDNPPGVAHK